MDRVEKMHLAKPEQFFRMVFEQSVEAYVLIGSDGRVFAANDAACTLFRRTEKDMCAARREGLVDMTSPKLGAYLQGRARTGRARAELTCIRGDGTRFTGETSSAVLSVDVADGLSVVMVRDVSEHRATALALTESQVLLDAIVNSTSDFVWFVEPKDFGLRWFNRTLEAYFADKRGLHIEVGMRPDDLFPDADHVQLWRWLYQRTLREGTVTFEYETYAKSNMLQLDLSVLIREGVVFGISVFGRDITRQKQDERDLRIISAAFDGSREALIITDVNAVMLRVNATFTTITGYSATDAIGQGVGILRSGRQDAAFYDAMWKELRENKLWRGELWNRRKDGELYLAVMDIGATVDAAGRVTGYVAAFSERAPV